MKTDNRQGRGYRAFLTLVATLAGGSTFTSCDSKVKYAVMGGLQTTFLSFFDPSLYFDTGDGTGTGTGTGLDFGNPFEQ